MTKKRFYKLLRAWCTGTASGKQVALVCKKQAGMKCNAEKKVSYSELWNIITNNGKIANGIGVKVGKQK
jgi:hypothetical protein